MNYDETALNEFKQLIDNAKHVLIIQAERVDADSLGSSLGLEAALMHAGVETTLYCYNEVPSYLRHMPGWDRVTNELPSSFDISILVDSSTTNQLERTWAEHKKPLLSKPFVCIDHHMSETGRIEGDNVHYLIDKQAGASSQQIVELARHFEWQIDKDSAYALASGIKADTVNLSTKQTTADTFMAMAYLVEQGADLESLRAAIEKTSSIPASQLHLRGEVLQRTQFFRDNTIAFTYFTAAECDALSEDKLLIEKMKHELRTLQEVEISIVITEKSGYSNASMRANIDVARLVAEHFGGGGHDRAASCRFEDATHEQVIEKMTPILHAKMDEHDEQTQAL